MDPWIAIFIFFLSVADDILVVFFMRRVMKGDKLLAGLLSGVTTAVVALEVTYYAPDRTYILPNSLGSCVGTPLAMWLEDKLPKLKARDKHTGKFKPTPALAQPQNQAQVITLKEKAE